MRAVRLWHLLCASVAIGALIVACGADRPGAAGAGTIAPVEERCATAGAVRECKVVLGDTNGVRTCAAGTQTCGPTGYWSACAIKPGGPALLQSINLDVATNGGLNILAVNPPSSTGTACANPCNPDCVGHDEHCRPDASVDAGMDGSTVCIPLATIIDPETTPTPGANPGFEKKVSADQCNNSGNSNPDARTCETGPFAPSSTDVANGRMASTCQADHYCEPTAGLGGPGCCKRFDIDQTHASQASGGLTCASALPDLTLAGACSAGGTGASANTVMAICNRGNALATGPIWVGTGSASDIPWNGGTAAAPSCLGAITYRCRYDGSIVPGGCVNISKFGPLGNGCGGDFPTGNMVVMVNGPGAPAVVPECDLDVKDTVNAAQPTQPGCANNLTAFNTNLLTPCAPSFTPLVMKETYTATCGPGERPRWSTIGWDGDTPSIGTARSTIEFRARLRDTLPDGGPGPWVGPTLVGKAWNNPDPTVYVEGPGICRPDQVTVNPDCPKQFSRTLPPSTMSYSTLELEISLFPVKRQTGGQLVPILRNWWVSYTCVDVE